MHIVVPLRHVCGGSAAGLEAVGGEGEGNGFVIGFPTSTRPASGGCGGYNWLTPAADPIGNDCFGLFGFSVYQVSLTA